MELSHVRYFLALCEDRNFTRAARRCGIAQPSLTKAIQVLETELGGRLFHRHHAGAELTALGAQVAPLFVTIWQCVEQVKELRRLMDRGRQNRSRRSRMIPPRQRGSHGFPDR
jgi:DNA-binding transcriptional LysR family regulator